MKIKQNQRVIGYIRCSTTEQAENGESISVQESIIKGYCLMNQIEITEWVIDAGVSGSVPLSKRTNGKELLELEKNDVVIAAKLDRCFRSSLDALETRNLYLKAGIKLHLIDLGGECISNGVSALFFTMISAFAEFERSRIQERVKDTKEKMKSEGRYLGGKVPYGFYVKDGYLVPDEDQQAVIAVVQELRQEGVPLRKVAKEVGLSVPTVMKLEKV